MAGTLNQSKLRNGISEIRSIYPSRTGFGKKVKKVKLAIEQAAKTLRGSRSIALLF
jgi:hypothetical protein